VSFLDVVGYWRQDQRFWSDAPVGGDAAVMCCRLRQRVEELGLKGWAAEGALRKLEGNCAQC
jgi:hypothetical protein